MRFGMPIRAGSRRIEKRLLALAGGHPELQTASSSSGCLLSQRLCSVCCWLSAHPAAGSFFAAVGCDQRASFLVMFFLQSFAYGFGTFLNMPFYVIMLRCGWA